MNDMTEYTNLEYIESTGTQYIDTGATCEQYNSVLTNHSYSPFSIKGTKIYDKDLLIENWVPVSTSNGDVGMYDIIGENYLDREAFLEIMEEHFRRADGVSISHNLI